MTAVLVALATEGRWIRTEVPFDVDGRTAGLVAAMWSGRAHGFVAERDGAIVGNVVTFLDPDTGAVGLGMGVLASERGRGVGGALLDAAVADCTARGVGEIRLEVYVNNSTARALYASRGFVEHGARYFEVRRAGSRWETVRMRRIA
jgi:ribosomal protein S18 acetylase RimI-like enzyme